MKLFLPFLWCLVVVSGLHVPTGNVWLKDVEAHSPRQWDQFSLRDLAEWHKIASSTPLEDLPLMEQEWLNGRVERAISFSDVADFINGFVVGTGVSLLNQVDGCYNGFKATFNAMGALVADYEGKSRVLVIRQLFEVGKEVTSAINNCGPLWRLVSKLAGWSNFVRIFRVGSDSEFWNQAAQFVAALQQGDAYGAGNALGRIAVKLAFARRDGTHLDEGAALLPRGSADPCAPMNPPPSWTCDPSYWNNDDGCDCECGGYDPDCDQGGQNVLCWLSTEPDSPDNSTYVSAQCNSTGSCNYKLVPVSWSCDSLYFNASDGCDCECGTYDPDCDTSGNVFNCPFGLNPTCTTLGTCAYPTPVPPTWLCAASLYNSTDGCDCTCGAPDPDCDLPFRPAYFCPCPSMKCIQPSELDLNTVCSGLCDGFIHSVTRVASSASQLSPSYITWTAFTLW